MAWARDALISMPPHHHGPCQRLSTIDTDTCRLSPPTNPFVMSWRLSSPRCRHSVGRDTPSGARVGAPSPPTAMELSMPMRNKFRDPWGGINVATALHCLKH
ncbi:hypothetical protein ACJBU6_06649 [Exserohilum turcicum]